ncbi:MAG: class E sortase [Microbacterium sp.]
MDDTTAVDAGETTPPLGGARRARRPSVVGVAGELLITRGNVKQLYVVWQLWVGDVIYGAQRNATGHELSQQWAQEYVPPTEPSAEPATPETVEPPVLPEPADAEIFGTMHIPRFGADYMVPMAGGVSRSGTLDPIGIGHYPGTVMPGQPGNFAVAAHRTTWGKPFNRIAELHVGDAIVVETPGGWYTYRFRTLAYVQPSQVEILRPVPQGFAPAAGTAYMTMTSCSPMYSLAERIVAFSVFESFTPRESGPPDALTQGV